MQVCIAFASFVACRSSIATVLAVGLLMLPLLARAEFRSVSVAAAVLYDAPSLKARKLFVAPRGMPLEVLSQINQWIKVRDMASDVMWIERGDLGGSQTVVASVLAATVRSAAQDAAPVVFQAERGVLLDVLDAGSTPGWLRVRHRDGLSGWIRIAEVWGA
jgi:SH3-like domain-containing protein